MSNVPSAAPAKGQDRLSTLARPTTAVGVRDRLIDMLRRDLVGPHPDFDKDLEREVLEGVNPSTWYLTGFLGPYRKPSVERRAALAAASQEELLGEEQAEKEIENLRETEGMEQGAPGPGAAPDQGALEQPPRRGFDASSLGLTVLLPRDATQLEARVTWGDYVIEPPLENAIILPEARAKAIEAGERPRAPSRSELCWRRIPREERVTIPIAAATSGKLDIIVPESAAPMRPGGALTLTVSVRPIKVPDLDGRQRDLLAVSVFLVNRRDEALRRWGDIAFCFQARLQLTFPRGFEKRDDRSSYQADGFDERLSDLHYRDVASYATGHNSSADWDEPEGNGRVTKVFTNALPCQTVEKLGADIDEVPVMRGMEDLATAAGSIEDLRKALAGLPPAYAAWAAGQSGAVAQIDGMRRQDAARRLLADIEVARLRIEAGIERLLADPVSREAFAIMNKTMAQANRQRAAASNGKPADQQKAPAWRLFQLAFILLNLDGLVDPLHGDRGVVDLLFFPTGGGKTEAYLGLAAFAIARRRLANPGEQGAGVSVIMRYTLRLLTLDQLQRAAGLVCALELERQKGGRLGTWPIEIGLWVGGRATPNSMGDARNSGERTAVYWLREYRAGRGPAPAPLKDCPWCGTKLGKNAFNLQPHAAQPQRLDIRCTHVDCAFSGKDRLPIVAVDDEIYRRLPAFMIATIDKFANVPWEGRAGAFFGNVERHDQTGFYGAAETGGQRLPGGTLPPIDLIIQDELHLISGPLGTVAGLYETAFDLLASRRINGEMRGPKIVASTATVRRAETQIRNLFGRTATAIFPPPGISRSDSFFAREDTATPSRLYVGIASPGRGPKLVFLRTLQTLLAGAAALSSGGKADPADPYLTALCYFNALRELGGARRIVDDEVRSHLTTYGDRRAYAASRQARFSPIGRCARSRS